MKLFILVIVLAYFIQDIYNKLELLSNKYSYDALSVRHLSIEDMGVFRYLPNGEKEQVMSITPGLISFFTDNSEGVEASISDSNIILKQNKNLAPSISLRDANDKELIFLGSSPEGKSSLEIIDD